MSKRIPKPGDSPDLGGSWCGDPQCPSCYINVEEQPAEEARYIPAPPTGAELKTIRLGLGAAALCIADYRKPPPAPITVDEVLEACAENQAKTIIQNLRERLQ